MCAMHYSKYFKQIHFFKKINPKMHVLLLFQWSRQNYVSYNFLPLAFTSLCNPLLLSTGETRGLLLTIRILMVKRLFFFLWMKFRPLISNTELIRRENILTLGLTLSADPLKKGPCFLQKSLEVGDTLSCLS